MKEQHTDKCCYWDNEDFCDCGERALNKLQAETDQLRQDLSRVSTERDELKNLLQEASNNLHAYSQDNKHAEVTRLIQERDTWKARWHNKTLRFNAVRARAKVDMARLTGERDKMRDALVKYGNHVDGCNWRKCSCGLDAALQCEDKETP